MNPDELPEQDGTPPPTPALVLSDTSRRVGWAALAFLLLAGTASLAGVLGARDARQRLDRTESLTRVALVASEIAIEGKDDLTATSTARSAYRQWETLAATARAQDLTPEEVAQLDRLHMALDALFVSASARPDERDGAFLTALGAARALLTASTQAASEHARFAGLGTAELSRLAGLLASGASVVLFFWYLGLHRRERRQDREVIDSLGELLRTDPLTGITNRRGLDETLPAEMARNQRAGTPLTAVMIDLDFFKRYNSRRGHAGGDSLLRTAAQRWRRQLRPSDLLARYGGEEFTLVLPRCDAEQAIQLVERLRPVMPDSQTFSAGIATWDGRESPAALLRRADTALLTAKKDGRNRTVVSGREDQISLPLAN